MADEQHGGAQGAPPSAVASPPISSETTTSKRFGKQVGSWMDELVAQGRTDAAEVSVDVRMDDEAPPSWTFKPLVPGAAPPKAAVVVEEPPPAARRPYALVAALAAVALAGLVAWLLLH